MNIFWLDTDLEKCAKAHCDKHVVKMILESCQMLSTAHHLLGNSGIAPYKKTHQNHPCTLWVCESASNYQTLLELARALCREYTHRYKKIHACQSLLDEKNADRMSLAYVPFYNPIRGSSIPPLAMPEYIKNAFPYIRTFDDVVQAYRLYYMLEKSDIAKWNYSDKPEWFIE